MKITLVTGGARSGKSRYAETLATELQPEGGGVSYLATARPHDSEMERRIAHHRARRPERWETVEVSAGIEDGLGRATYPVVILDCLTLLLTGAIFAVDEGSPGLPDPDGLNEAQVEARAQEAVDELLNSAARRAGRLIVVTNELGMGIVPEHPLGRWFRDAQGRANQRVAAVADRVVFMVSGIPWTLKGSPGH